MKVIKARIYQSYARYDASNGKQGSWCYPLPPYSTVIGFLHTICVWNTYHDMQLSIAGFGYQNNEKKMTWQGGAKAKTLTEDFKRRFPVRVYDQLETYTGWVQVPKYYDFIADLNLTLHIKPNDEDFNTVYDALLYPAVYPAIGQYDNLVRIDSVSVVEVGEMEGVITTRTGAYVPVERCLSDICCSVYNLHKRYHVVGDRRVFDKVKAYCVSPGTRIECSAALDEEGDAVFLA